MAASNLQLERRVLLLESKHEEFLLKHAWERDRADLPHINKMQEIKLRIDEIDAEMKAKGETP